MLVKIVLTCVPAAATAPNATSAMSAPSKRVLEQVLARVVLREATETFDQSHWASPAT